MLVTESKLRQIVKEEYAALQKEIKSYIGYGPKNIKPEPIHSDSFSAFLAALEEYEKHPGDNDIYKKLKAASKTLPLSDVEKAIKAAMRTDRELPDMLGL